MSYQSLQLLLHLTDFIPNFFFHISLINYEEQGDFLRDHLPIKQLLSVVPFQSSFVFINSFLWQFHLLLICLCLSSFPFISMVMLIYLPLGGSSSPRSEHTYCKSSFFCRALVGSRLVREGFQATTPLVVTKSIRIDAEAPSNSDIAEGWCRVECENIGSTDVSRGVVADVKCLQSCTQVPKCLLAFS